MVYSFDGHSYNYFIRLSKGERLSECLQQFAAATKVKSGWLNGLGGVLEVELGYYNLDTKEYQWHIFKGTREMASLQGSLASSEQGGIMPHLHGVFADSKYQTVGGHVKDLVAAATVELFVQRSNKPMQRKHDPSLGLQTLDL